MLDTSEVEYVIGKILEMTQNYHKFIRVLDCKKVHYGGIWQQLNRMIHDKQLADISENHGQSSVPPASHNLGMSDQRDIASSEVWTRE